MENYFIKTALFGKTEFLYYNVCMEKEKILEKKISQEDIDKYQDPSGLNLKKLRFGLWYLERRHRFYLGLVGFLIFINSILWLYSIYNIVDYIFFGMAQNNKLLEELAAPKNELNEYTRANQPQALQISEPLILKADSKTDLAVKIINPNLGHRVDFDYYFLINNGETAHKTGFIFPSETKYFVSLGQEGVDKNAQFILVNLRWQRINKHLISDFSSFKNDRLNMIISDIEFIPANNSGLSEKINLNRFKFNAVNNSAYNYWQAKFIIVLQGAYGPIGFNEYSFAEFMSGQKRKAEISWPGSLPAVNDIEIISDIDFMDENNYLLPDGGEGRLK